MERLTFDGNFCDISQCAEVGFWPECKTDGCSQRKVWERLKRYEDLEEQGRLVVLPEADEKSMELMKQIEFLKSGTLSPELLFRLSSIPLTLTGTKGAKQ